MTNHNSPQPTEQPEGDWKYDYDFLVNLTAKINAESNEGLSMEEVEAVLSAINYKPEPLPSPQPESVDALGEEILLDFIGIAPRGNTYLIKDGVSIKSQLLKAMEAYLYASLPIKIKSLCDTLQNTAQLLAGIKPDAIQEGWWSEWDESVEQSVINQLKAISPFYNKEYAAALASQVDAEPSPQRSIIEEASEDELRSVGLSGKPSPQEPSKK